MQNARCKFKMETAQWQSKSALKALLHKGGLISKCPGLCGCKITSSGKMLALAQCGRHHTWNCSCDSLRGLEKLDHVSIINMC